MAEARFLYGNPLMIKHTPTSAVAAGEVVEIVADTGPIGIAHNNIAANARGNLSVGPAVYECVCTDTGLSAGTFVFWDTTANEVTTDDAIGTNPPFGRILKATTATQQKVPVALAIQSGTINPT